VIKLELARPALLAVTVVRLNDCRHFGSFRVHAGKGLNRIPFRGRVNGRPLPSGTYRLLFRPPRTRDVRATATVMVIRGKPTAAKIRRVRQTSCSGTARTFVSFAFGTAGFPTSTAAPAADRASRSPLGALEHSLAKKSKSVVKRGEALGARFAARPEDPQAVSPFVLVIVGLLLLASAGLGFVLALQAWRQLRPSRA
jgi:hypothetical protein